MRWSLNLYISLYSRICLDIYLDLLPFGSGATVFKLAVKAVKFYDVRVLFLVLAACWWNQSDVTRENCPLWWRLRKRLQSSQSSDPLRIFSTVLYTPELAIWKTWKRQWLKGLCKSLRQFPSCLRLNSWRWVWHGLTMFDASNAHEKNGAVFEQLQAGQGQAAHHWWCCSSTIRSDSGGNLGVRQRTMYLLEKI